MRYCLLRHLLSLLVLLLTACAAPRNLPEGPTPIPTLIPVIEPADALTAEATPSFTILSYPAQAPSSARGELNYQSHCAQCHGEDGKGTVPGARNFNDLDYMRGESPASFYEVVTEGRGEMSAFKNTLSSDERWDVVFYLWRFSTSAEILVLGKSLYDANCAACHGEDGVGKVLGAADFTDLRFMYDRAPRDFYLVVTQGKGSMPAWQGRLSQEERWAVIDYLWTFSYEASLIGENVTVPATPTLAIQANCTSAYISPPNPFSWDDAETIASGQVIYDRSCSICHSSDGSGTMPGAPDFTTGEVQEELLATDGDFQCVVAEGRGAMPGWKETLSPEEIWQVLTYMSTFGK